MRASSLLLLSLSLFLSAPLVGCFKVDNPPEVAIVGIADGILSDVSAPLAPGKRFDKIPNPLGILLRMGLSGFEKKQKAAADQTAEKAPEAEATDEQVAV